ncbi:hypothetical protein EON09_00840 [Pseudomonas soli]|jgi:hypothetical protein|uniref:Uncharacterized protein n=1 Tax=Pseudomonas soli TaxID=1306993 RepID=A0AAJ5MHM0_9PSED|nr:MULTISPECIES: hypothetical protein [Pseudomonas]MCX5508428.1 hypothetical protein [Pseudomonas sp. BJa3]MDT3712838.1 hypothetical protein [Pseudomonas soli]MDT3730174.1 hypothetical protein [Pseudomonas soli]NBK37073.1 hypothetical protein [Pseudomonas soli]UXZ44478.1 hypothetical protein K7K07_20740 [Pseudomonas soli]
MSSLSPGPDATRRIRPKLFWRLLFLLVCLLAAFLYAGFISLGGYLLMLGFDQEAAQPRRLLAFAGAALILLVGGWLLKVAMPRKLVPTVVERER